MISSLAARRADYEAAVTRLKSEALELIVRGRSAEQAARYVVERRNLLKIEFRQDLPPAVLALIEERNRRKYGHAVGPTAEALFERYGSWPAVIAAASRHA